MSRRPPSSRPPASGGSSSPSFLSNYTSLAVVGGVFILGIGIGIFISSGTAAGTGSVVSLKEIDTVAPNPEVCVQFGASAIAMDTRVFLTLNPFNVYVSQPKMQPGCVLRSSNWEVLRQRNLISADQVRECKNRMNTFGFTGNLESSPQINCIYQNDSAQNFFLNQPGVGAPPPESEKF